jgi:protein-S-isoprenylcysteine O-methyltransferase Ste14
MTAELSKAERLRSNSALSPGWELMLRVLGNWSGRLTILWVTAPFAGAWTLRFLPGWVFVALVVGGLRIHRAYVVRQNAAVLAARRGVASGAKLWDKVWNAVFWPLMVITSFVSGLDAGALSTPLARWSLLSGSIVFCLGTAMSAWAMGVNPHFEGTVRIQTERGHRVIAVGPYRLVRHPGYAALVLWAVAAPLVFASRAGLVAAVVSVLWIVLRTFLEDGTLKRELAGYAEYTERVRSRLIPRLW